MAPKANDFVVQSSSPRSASPTTEHAGAAATSATQSKAAASTTSTNPAAAQSPTVVVNDRISLFELARATALAIPIVCILNYYGLFASTTPYFYVSCYLVSLVMTPAVNTLSEYILPVAMVLWQHFYAKDLNVTYFQMGCFMPIVLFLIGVNMSVCLHRYFSHGAFQTTRAFQFVIGFMACLAYQSGPLWWAAKHIRHHHHCDNELDPHSVTQDGYFYAFVGWTMNPANLAERDYPYLNSRKKTLMVPEMLFLDKNYILPVVMVLTIMEANFGRTATLIMLYMPMLVCRLITLLFNVEYHPADDPKRCKSVNDPRYLAVIVGESEHDDHHKVPNRSRRLDLDLAWWVSLSWMEAVGLVWNCR